MTEMEMMTIMERQVSWITWLSWKIQKRNGAEYDLLMFCEFLNISIKVYTSSLVKNTGDKIIVELPFHYGEKSEVSIHLWHFQEHYEPIEVPHK
jgi:hypothetical protein